MPIQRAVSRLVECTNFNGCTVVINIRSFGTPLLRCYVVSASSLHCVLRSFGISLLQRLRLIPYLLIIVNGETKITRYYKAN